MKHIPDLIGAAKDGDRTAKELLFQRYRPYLTRLATTEAKRIQNSRQDLADIVQEACLKASHALPQFAGSSEGEFASWLRTILLNRIQEAHRSNTAQIRDIRRERNAVMAFEDNRCSPLSHAICQETAEKLLTAIETLPELEKTAVRMRYLQQAELKQIAAVLNRSVSTVAGIIRRGLNRLQSDLPKSLASSY